MALKFRPSVERLDDRSLPSTTIVNGEQFSLTGTEGTAQVTLTVVEDEPGYEGFYHWHYVVQNVDYGDPSGNQAWMEFYLNATAVGGVENLQSSLGWDGTVQANPDGSGFIVWDMGTHSPLRVGQSAEFSFLTAPMPVGDGLGDLVDDDPMGAAAEGALLAPSKGFRLDFANATINQDYFLWIRGYSGNNKLDDVYVTITKNATATDIAGLVKDALVASGYKVT